MLPPGCRNGPDWTPAWKAVTPMCREFLRQAATEQGASWDLITAAVAGWLGDPENTVNLRVVLRS